MTIPKTPKSHKRSRRSDDGAAFLPDPFASPGRTGAMHSDDTLAEALGEEYVAAATTGEAAGESFRDALVPEEDGGPFVTTKSAQEFADGTDALNPDGATVEPFPAAVRGLD